MIETPDREGEHKHARLSHITKEANVGSQKLVLLLSENKKGAGEIPQPQLRSAIVAQNSNSAGCSVFFSDSAFSLLYLRSALSFSALALMRWR